MARSKLKKIALDMRGALNKAQPPAWTKYDLPDGLQIILHRPDAELWRLALRRQNVPPSPDEIEHCAKVFDVPEGSEPKVYVKRSFQIAELTWREYA